MKKKSSESRFGKLPQECFYNDLRDGEIDEIIKKFNVLEIPFFEYTSHSKDIRWWDFIRYYIVHNICVEKGLYGDQRNYKRKFLARLPSLIIQIKKFLFSIKNLSKVNFNNIKFLSISSRKLNKYFYNDDLEIENTLIILKEKSDNYKNYIYKDSLENFIKLFSKCIRVPNKVQIQSNNISEVIQNSISTKINISRLIEEKYKYCVASVYVWKFIFKYFLKEVNLIKYTNDNLQKPLVYVANQNNIKTLEIQHAYMGKSNEAFCYPNLFKKPISIPNSTLVYFDSKDITYPSNIINCCQEEKNTSKAEKKIKIDLLIGSGPTSSKTTKKILSIIQNLDLRIAIKLHPSEHLSDLNIQEILKNKSIKIIKGKENFSNIASITKIFIPVDHYSTTIFEARKEDCEIIIFDESSRKISNIPNLITPPPLFCYSSDSLIILINQILKS